MIVWIDVTNTPHVSVLMPIIRQLEKNHSIVITARTFSETVALLKMEGIDPLVVGGYGGKSRIMKFLTNGFRILRLIKSVPQFDISFSLGGNFVAAVSWWKNKPSIIFSDNDISFKALAFLFGDYFIFPTYFRSENIERKYSLNRANVFKFNGFKEDIYISDYRPDSNFLSKLPFEEFITIRPENLKASYVPKNSTTIIPELFEEFQDKNILFLPRYKEEKQYADGYPNVFVPPGPLRGLDVVYYSQAVLTGAGTFAREAALLGVPSVSFFPGNTFLSVDLILQKRGWEFNSRNVKEIRQYLEGAKKRSFERKRSKDVLDDILGIIDNILNKI